MLLIIYTHKLPLESNVLTIPPEIDVHDFQNFRLDKKGFDTVYNVNIHYASNALCLVFTGTFLRLFRCPVDQTTTLWLQATIMTHSSCTCSPATSVFLSSPSSSLMET